MRHGGPAADREGERRGGRLPLPRGRRPDLIKAAEPSVYRTRSYTLRQRVLTALAAVGLLLLGYLIGRWQDTPGPAATPVAAPTTAASVTPSPSPALTTSPPTPTVYATLQAESANGNLGTDSQDTEDEGGGRNVAWITNGDALRFDNFDFGPVPATKVDVRIASDSDDGGRMEIRLDSPDRPAIGTLRVTPTGGWQDWRTDEVTIAPVTGVHTIFLTFAAGDDDDFVNINWLLFGR